MPSWADLARGKSPQTLKPATPNPATPFPSTHRQHSLDDDGFEHYDPAMFEDDYHQKKQQKEGEDDGINNDSHYEAAQQQNRPTSSLSSSTPVVARGEGLLLSTTGTIPSDVWSMILSYCPYSDVLRVGHTCTPLRRLSMRPQLWYAIKERFTMQYELDVGHAVPADLEFTLPACLSKTVTVNRRRAATTTTTTTTVIDDENEIAAEFIRYVRFLERSEHRMWHLKEFKGSYAPIASGAVRMGYVADGYDANPSPSRTIVATTQFPMTITAVDRSRSPFLKPSDVSTVFSHQAANAMAACRLETTLITNAFSEATLLRLKTALMTQGLHKDLSRILVSASLIELSLPEAVQCIDSYKKNGVRRGGGGGEGGVGAAAAVGGAGQQQRVDHYRHRRDYRAEAADEYYYGSDNDADDHHNHRGRGGEAARHRRDHHSSSPSGHHHHQSMLAMLLDDVTIDESETRCFAIRQLSSEANIAIILSDPILTLVIAAGAAN